MKQIAIIFCILFSFTTLNAQNSIAGIWNMGEDNTKIEITETDGVFIGKIISSDNAKAKVGKQILKDVKFSNGKGKGKMYAAKKGKWYDAVIKEKGDQLNVTIKVGFMSKTLEWKKE